MTRAHLYRPLQDSAGNLQRGATVRLLRPGTLAPIDDQIFIGPDGTETYSQPIACPHGFLDVYFDLPVRVRVGVTPFGGGTEVFFENIDPDVPSQSAVQTPLDPINGLTALDVQNAISELQANKYGADKPLPGLEARYVEFAPAGTIGAANVQAALEELDEDVVAVASAATALDGRLDTAEATLVTQTGRLDDHDDRFDGLEASDVALDGRLDAVEAAVPAVDLRVTNHIDDAGDAHDASSVSVTPVGDITASDVQSALAEIDTRLTEATDGAAARTAWRQELASYTLTLTDATVFMLGPDLTATLPTAVGNAGKQFTIKNQHTSVLTVATAAGLIDGDATRALAQYDSLTVVSDGTDWGVI